MAVFPIRQDRIGLGVILAVAFIAVSLFGSPFLMEVVMIPFLVLSLATIGLNLLIGYTGLISLGGSVAKFGVVRRDAFRARETASCRTLRDVTSRVKPFFGRSVGIAAMG